ncbi:MAG: alkaline phosphatase family protein [Bdellovibrionaceae bacterium]|nr:alkaline phosphatase family protein [Pseudobdellovibrionaceae bacterium]MDW8190330.1 alkaline phosphatase D family protein [Pseudobdellovibrionaceae bacterium]
MFKRLKECYLGSWWIYMKKCIVFSILFIGIVGCRHRVSSESVEDKIKSPSNRGYVLSEVVTAILQKSPNAPLKINQNIRRIAFGSCMDQHYAQPVWEALNRDQVDLFIGLGDLVYASAPADKPMGKAYLEQIEKNPQLIEFRKKVPWLGVWDDHDFGINDGGGHHPEYSEAKSLLMAFLPNSAKVMPPEEEKGVYHSVILGNKPQTLQIIFLDTRTHRSPLLPHPEAKNNPKLRYSPSDDPQARFLSEEQWAWLEQEFMKPANVRLLISSIQVLPDQHGFEKWGNFPKERERLLQLIKKHRLKNLVILSGDRHFSEVSRVPLNKKRFLYEITSSGLNRESNLMDEKNPFRVNGSAYFKPNYGLIEIDYARGRIIYQTKDQMGQEVFKIQIPLR